MNVIQHKSEIIKFVSNLPTAVQHICSCSAREPDTWETSADTTPAARWTGGEGVGVGVELGGVKMRTTTITTDDEDEKEVDR